MPNFDVQVSFIPAPAGFDVSTTPHPAPGNGAAIGRGATMKWTLVNPEDDVQMQVGFREAFELPAGARKPVGPMGPFDSLLREGNTVTGTIAFNSPEDRTRTWRYVCVIFRNSQQILWEGGVDTHRPPPP